MRLTKVKETMSSHRSHSNRDDDKRADDPPMSRLFIICNKNQNEEDFRDAFDKFGTIEEVWVVRDKSTGDNKGMHYSCVIVFIRAIVI